MIVRLLLLPWGAHQGGLKQHSCHHGTNQHQRHEFAHAGRARMIG
jgi:hypothetical protein